MLDNRELAGLIWISLFLVWALSRPKVRAHIPALVRAATQKKIVAVLLLMAAYLAGAAALLQLAGLWGQGSVKNTVLWGCTAGVAMIGQVVKVPPEERPYVSALKGGLKVSVVLEFVANLYSMNLAAELVLILVATLAGVMLVFAEHDDEFSVLKSPLTNVLAGIGLVLATFAAYQVSTRFDTFASWSTARAFILPFALTLSFFPFLICLAVYSAYEWAAIRLGFCIEDHRLRRFALTRILLKFGLRTTSIRGATQALLARRPSSKADVVAALAQYGRVRGAHAGMA